MSNPMITRLIAKDLHVNRWFMTGVVVSGLVSLVIASTSRIGFNIGSVSFITTLVAFGVILAMYGCFNERKEKTALFVLSLPLSTAEYVKAKVLGMLAVYLVPWTILTAGAVALFLATPIPDGLVTPTVLLSVFYLAIFCIVVAVTLSTTSEVVTSVTIILTNMSVTLFMFAIFGNPTIAEDAKSDVVVWSAPVLTLLTGEALCIALALALPFLFRKRDYI
jgi:ABC-2 type transport system permease protein